MLWWVKITNQLASPRTGRCSHQFTGVQQLSSCSFTWPPPGAPHGPAASHHLSPLFSLLLFFWLLGFPCPPPAWLPISSIPVQETDSPPSHEAQFPPTEEGEEPPWAGVEGAVRAPRNTHSPSSPSSLSQSGPGVKTEHDPWGGGSAQPRPRPCLPLGFLCPPFCPAPTPHLCLPCSLLPSCHPMNSPSPTHPSQATRATLLRSQEQENGPCPQEASGLSLDENHTCLTAVKSARHQVMQS